MSCFSAHGQAVRLISSTPASPTGGNRDSWAPIGSADGRFVVFASAANNLTLPGCLTNGFLFVNVFLRDRNLGTTRLVSANVSGYVGGNDNSIPAGVSADGRYVMFTSAATDLVAGFTNDVCGVFLRDMVGNITLPVTVDDADRPANRSSRAGGMSADARYVVFVSAATNLVPGFTNTGVTGVHVRDMLEGGTSLASVPAGADDFPDGDSDSPSMTPDGRYVVFRSTAMNMANGVSGAGDIFVRDLSAKTTRWISAGGRALLPSFSATNLVCASSRISDDGSIVIYAAKPNNQTAGFVFRCDLKTGVTELICTNALVSTDTLDDDYGHSLDMAADGKRIAYVGYVSTNSSAVLVWDESERITRVVSASVAGTISPGAMAARPLLDPTGQYVAFLCSASDLVTNAPFSGPHLYIRDLSTGMVRMAGADANDSGSSLSWQATFGFSDGTLFFDSADSGFVQGDWNGVSDVFAWVPGSNSVELISAHESDLATVTANGSSQIGNRATSADNRYVAFVSDANTLVLNQVTRGRNVYVRDVVSGCNILASIGTNGLPVNGNSYEPSISADGNCVAFTSVYSNGNWGVVKQVLVRDLQAGITVSGSLQFQNASSPQISKDGKLLVFRSSPKTTDPSFTLIARDLGTGLITPLASGVRDAELLPDGNTVAYLSGAGVVYLCDVRGRPLFQSTVCGTNFAISASGQRVAINSNILSWIDLPSKTDYVFDRVRASHTSLAFSADGNKLVAVENTKPSQVVLYSILTGVKALVSHAEGGALIPGNDASDQPTISPDGRFVAYRTRATNIAGVNDGRAYVIMLYDTVSGLNRMITPPGSNAPGNISRNPVFSDSANVLYFQSFAPGMVPSDFNSAEDVFAVGLPELNFNHPRYAPGEMAAITLSHPWLNSDFSGTDSVWVRVQSELDPVGINLQLVETGTNTGVFASSAAGTNVGFTAGQSDDSAKVLHVAEGSVVWVSFQPGAPDLNLTNYAVFSTNPPVVIAEQPADIAIARGQTGWLRVEALSFYPLTYQWFFKNSAVYGAISNTIVITNAQSGNAGGYRVLVSNFSGSVTSASAVVIVGDPPVIDTQPADVRAQLGDMFGVSIGASGTPPMLIGWWLNGTNQVQSEVAQSSSGYFDLNLGPLELSHLGRYSVTISNAFGVVASESVWVGLEGPAPALSPLRAENGSLRFSISGQPGVVYLLLESSDLVSWSTNQVFLLNADGQTLTIPVGSQQMFYQLQQK